MKKNTNANIFKLFSVLFVLVLSAVSVSALSLLTEFDEGISQKSIMPGTSTNYYVMGVADQGLDRMTVSAKFYDITTGEKEFLGELFSFTSSETFFFPPAFSINPRDYTDLPGSYIISVKAEEWLTNGVYRTTTSELDLEVIGNRLPVADFIYDPSNPSTLSNVKFTSTSYDTDGSIVKWEWFADSVKIGEGQTITYKFNNAGTYEVTLRVTDNEGGVASAKKPVVVSKGAQDIYPVALFTYTPSNPIANQQITFTSNSYDSDGSIVKEEWDFNNDGIFETTGHVVNKAFAQSGSYTVTLKVTDNSNLQASISKVIVVNPAPVNVPPVADFVYTPSNPMVDESIVFTSTSYDSDGYIVAYAWSLDGVAQGSTESIGMNFAFPGTHSITLKVTDNSGASSSITKQITISAPVNVPPVANFIYSPLDPEVDESISFTSTSYDVDGSIVKEEWDFNNDGIFEIPFEVTGYVVAKSFSQPGNYPVSLRVTDNKGAKSTVTKVVIVKSAPPVNVAPVADFVYSPSVNITVGQAVTFTSTSYDVDGSIVKEEWDLNGDGLFTWSGHSVVKTFAASGSYVVYLRVFDDDGASSIVSKVVVVNPAPPVNVPPVAEFTYLPCSNITCNQNVVFTSTSYDSDGYLSSQSWYVNGVFAGSGSTLTKAFSNSGSYTVTLTVKDNSGASDSKTKQIVVTCAPVNVAPVADFVYSPSVNITVGQAVTFTSTSYDVDGSIVKEEWDLNGDGLFTWSGHSVVKTFAASGSYVVYLRVFDDDGASSIVSKVVVVNPAPPVNVPPVAEFTYAPLNPNVNEQVVFTSNSYDTDGVIVSQEWYVNGNLISNNVVLNHVFSNTGTYSVMLKVIDDDGASDSETKNVVVSTALCPPTAVLVMPESVVVNTLVKMDGSLSTAGCDATITEYKWQIYKQNVLINEIITAMPYSNYTFSSNAEYKVVLTVYNSNMLSDSDEKLVFAGRAKNDIVIGSEDDLFVDYFDVIGSDYGVIECTQSFAITATVSNDREEDIEDLRVTFAIPELGYKIKSQAFDLDAGKTKTITFYGDLDMMKEEVIPGEYYAFIGASDTDTIRVKYFPLIIN